MFQNYEDNGVHDLKTFNKTIGPEIVVDTGIIIEYFEGTDRGKKIKTFIFENEFINSILEIQILQWSALLKVEILSSHI